MIDWLLQQYGVPWPNARPNTVALESMGQTVGPPYQPGDLLFWGPHGGSWHVSIAVGNGYRIGADNDNDGTVYRPIDNWPPSFGVRIPALSAHASGGSSDDDSGAADQPEQYTCEADYLSPWADKPGIGKIWAGEFSSDTITDENALKEAMKAQLHDYPDVQYTVDWISFKKNVGDLTNEIKVGDNGWLRDRMGTDVNVQIQSYTKYLDNADPSNGDSITFGNKIFDSALYDSRQNQANDVRKQIEALKQSNEKTNNISYTIPTMTGEEVQRLDEYFKQ